MPTIPSQQQQITQLLNTINNATLRLASLWGRESMPGIGRSSGSTGSTVRRSAKSKRRLTGAALAAHQARQGKQNVTPMNRRRTA
jgi:hypothetical protein